MNWAEHAAANDREFEGIRPAIPPGFTLVPIFRYDVRKNARQTYSWEVFDTISNRVVERFRVRELALEKRARKNATWKRMLEGKTR